METKKKTKIVTTTTDTAKRKANKGNLTKRNLKSSAKEIKENAPSTRPVMYLYPKDCTTPDQRKEFRRKARATARRMEKNAQILANTKERGAKTSLLNLNKEISAFKQNTYTNPN